MIGRSKRKNAKSSGNRAKCVVVFAPCCPLNCCLDEVFVKMPQSTSVRLGEIERRSPYSPLRQGVAKENTPIIPNSVSLQGIVRPRRSLSEEDAGRGDKSEAIFSGQSQQPVQILSPNQIFIELSDRVSNSRSREGRTDLGK